MTLLDTFFNGQVMVSAFPALMRGLFNTLLLGLLAIGIGIPVGLVISLVRLYAPKPFRWLAIGYIDIFRAMPVLVVLILIYYALPFVGIRFSSWVSATLAFTFVMSAYSAEVFRSGIESIPERPVRGGAGARPAVPADACARSSCRRRCASSFRPTTSNCVSMFKDTSLASTVALPELLKEANDAQALYANPSPLIAAAVVYLAFLWPMVRLVGYLEKRSKTATR